MGFLVEVKSCKENKRHIERIDIELLAAAKRTGLSFAELNEFRVRDLLAYINAYTGAEDEGPRQATQEDIDRFYS